MDREMMWARQHLRGKDRWALDEDSLRGRPWRGIDDDDDDDSYASVHWMWALAQHLVTLVLVLFCLREAIATCLKVHHGLGRIR